MMILFLPLKFGLYIWEIKQPELFVEMAFHFDQQLKQKTLHQESSKLKMS